MIKECHVGVKGIVYVNGRCLVLQKGADKDAYWDIPGGRIDDNETLVETLHRELEEELPSLKQYTVDELVGAYRLSQNIDNDKGLVLIFYKVNAEEFEVKLSAEHTDFKWVTKDDVSELLKSNIPIEKGYYEAIVKALE